MFTADKDVLDTLSQVGELLAFRGLHVEIVIAGGAGLLIRGIIRRATQDVDVFAIRDAGGMLARAADGLPKDLLDAARDVGHRRGLADDWLNATMARGGPWMPPGFVDRIRWVAMPGLRIGLVGRADFIAFKLEAAADHMPDESKHLADLRALAPTAAELDQAERWLGETNTGEGFFAGISWVKNHVTEHGSGE